MIDLVKLSDDDINHVLSDIESASGASHVDIRRLRAAINSARDPNLVLNQKLNAALSNEADLVKHYTKPMLKEAINKQKQTTHKYAAFLSHHKAGAAMEGTSRCV